MDEHSPTLIPAGTVFTPEDVTFWADRSTRSLDEAIADADLLVSAPHAGAAIPEELAPFLAPEFTRRLQYDFSDVSTSAIVRRWAEIDHRIVVVENPHPRMLRDPNREPPADLRATLREAFARVRAAGPNAHVDLSGVDAVRPVTFSFYPLLSVPSDDAEIDRIADAFAAVAERGLRVYENTRDELSDRFVAKTFAEGSTGAASAFTRLSFHDTMNATTTVDGAVNVQRERADRLPAVVALSNRGDHEGEAIGDGVVTMAPEHLRLLAQTHRSAFAVADAASVALNQPYLGSFEIIDAGARFRTVSAEAASLGVSLGAVQAEFLREFLLGEANTAVLQQPGTAWVEPDAEHVDRIARACMRAWDVYRDATGD